MLAILVVPAILGSAAPAKAATARAQFGIRLVIAPRCVDPADPSRDVTAAAATPMQAQDLAARALGMAGDQLVAGHDYKDAGWWIVSLTAVGAPGANADAVPVLRVEKCSGRVERPGPRRG